MAEVLQQQIRPDGRPKRRRWPWITLIIVILFLFIVIMGLSWYVTDSLIHPESKPIKLTPQSVSLPYEPITFESRKDHVKLKGWVMKPANATHKWVVLSHGYRGNRLIWPTIDKGKDGLKFMKMLVQNGYNVVAFDYRNSGESGGSQTTVGYYEQLDLDGAVDHIVEKDPQAQVALIGWSQGAATTLMSASHSPAVKLAVADSSFSNLSNYLKTNLPHWSHLPQYPFTAIILNFWIPVLSGLDTSKVAPINAVEDFDGPILLVHSAADQAIPIKNSKKIYERYRQSKDITFKIFPKAAHTESYILFPKAYEKMLMQFFSEKGFTP